MLVHIVIFKFNEQNFEANILKVTQELNSLVDKIDVLKSMEVGVNFTQSDRAFDLSLYSTFETKEDLQA